MRRLRVYSGPDLNQPNVAPREPSSETAVRITLGEVLPLLADAVALYAAAGEPVGDDFREVFDLCAMQRLMQALGAYGFLGLVKGHPQFLAHIPAALDSLRAIAGRIAGLDQFRRLLDRLDAAIDDEGLG